MEVYFIIFNMVSTKEKRLGMEIETTLRDLPKKVQGLKLSLDTPIKIIIEELNSRVESAMQQKIKTKPSDDFQALLNFKPIKGKRPVVEVIREIRASE